MNLGALQVSLIISWCYEHQFAESLYVLFFDQVLMLDHRFEQTPRSRRCSSLRGVGNVEKHCVSVNGFELKRLCTAFSNNKPLKRKRVEDFFSHSAVAATRTLVHISVLVEAQPLAR